MKFIDEAEIIVEAGSGGNGCVSFRREKFIPRGGPDGGDGGRGGDVILKAAHHLSTLLDQKYRQLYRAKRGTHGRGKDMHGRRGDNLVVRVPVGTVVKEADSGKALGDLTSRGEELLIARGGRGGRGNARFTTSRNQAPPSAEKGEPGDNLRLRLELKLLADVGLVGFPNAGKSTLIARVSAARPKIADYPFTTLVPNLGVVSYKDEASFVIADIPGIIKGAHTGAGLGLRFLRHIERARILLYLIDLSAPPSVSGGRGNPGPGGTFGTLRKELSSHDATLAKKPFVIALNKIDLPDARSKIDRITRSLDRCGAPCFPISAATGEGVAPLMDRLAEMVLTPPESNGEAI